MPEPFRGRPVAGLFHVARDSPAVLVRNFLTTGFFRMTPSGPRALLKHLQEERSLFRTVDEQVGCLACMLSALAVEIACVYQCSSDNQSFEMI